MISSVFLCYLGWSLWPTTIHILLPGATNQHAKKWSHFLGGGVVVCVSVQSYAINLQIDNDDGRLIGT